MPGNQPARAFTIVELLVVIATITAVCLAAAPSLTQARRTAGLAGSLANLRKIGETTGAYCADFDNQAWSFSWAPGNFTTEYDDLRAPPNEATAVMYQTVDIIRRLSGREDHPRYDNYFQPLYLGTLVLADYLQDGLPAEWAVSPGDRIRQEWAADPDSPPDDIWEPPFGATMGPFGSSYVHMPAFIAPDVKTDGRNTIYQYGQSHYLMWVPDIAFGGQHMDDVAFPGQKVLMAERESYYFGPRPVYYLHPFARVPVLMVDGPAAPRTTSDANESWRPNNPESSWSTKTDYRPRLPYETPAVDEVNGIDHLLETAYKWTRGGRSGIDFAGEREE